MKVTCLTLGDVAVCQELLTMRVVRMDREKSAEGIVIRIDTGKKGRTWIVKAVAKRSAMLEAYREGTFQKQGEPL